MNNAIVAAKNQTRGELSELSQPAAKSEWLWIASIYMLLVISGAIRYWRDWQFQSLSRENETSPFPLRELPKVLGRWHMAEGSEKTLEADIARIAGANDYVEWNYVDEASGESVTVMVLYGLAHRVWPHVPDTCYPANGFKPASPPSDLDIPIPGTTTKARFRVQDFTRLRSGLREHLVVYHSLRNAGAWGLDMGRNWKLFRYHPGMFKVMVQRQASIGAQKQQDDSINELLGLIVHEIDRRSAEKH